jgi:hypothetical protein
VWRDPVRRAQDDEQNRDETQRQPDSVPPGPARQMLALQTSAGNAAACRAVAGDRALSRTSASWLMRDISAPPDEASARKRAEELISEFERNATDFQSAQKDWQMANYIDFLTQTSSNPSVSWGNSTAFGLFAEALSSAAGISVLKYMDHGMKKPVGPIVGGALVRGAAAGFVLGVLVEYGVTFLLDKLTGKSDAEARAVAQAVAANNKLIQTQLVHLKTAETAAKATIRSTADRLKAELAATTDTEAIYAIQREAWESANALRKTVHEDRSLLRAMLREWVLEHAGDENESNTETSEDQWKDARTAAFGKGRSLDQHPEIFAYQARNHWDGIGLAGADLAAPMIKDAEAAGAKGADQVIKRWDGKTFAFARTQKPEAFAAMLQTHADRIPTDDTKAALKEGRFKLVAKLDLHEYHGAVYVDNFDYTLNLQGPSDTKWWSVGTGRSPASGAILANKARKSEIDFSVNPDDD